MILYAFAATWATALVTAATSTSINARQSTWQIDPNPVFDLGAESGDTLDTFGEVVGAARVPNGDIVVADAKYHSLRYCMPDRKFRRSAGRQGDGPGEFQSIMATMRCGDSLFVQARGTGRWSVFGPTGVFKRRYIPVLPSMRDQVPYDIRCNTTGLLINDGWENPADRKVAAFRSAVPFWMANADGLIHAWLGDLPSGERYGTVSRSTGPMPLGKQPVIAIGLTRAYVGTADSFANMVFGFNGKSIGMVRKANVNLVTTPADIQQFIAFDTAGKLEDYKASDLRRFQEMNFPSTIPAYRNLAVESEDDVWVERYPRAGENTSHWVVFSPTGTEFVQVHLPSNLKIQEIGYALGIATELPDSVHHVKMYHPKR